MSAATNAFFYEIQDILDRREEIRWEQMWRNYERGGEFRDDDGYDKDGYDREGYDRDGFDRACMKRDENVQQDLSSDWDREYDWVNRHWYEVIEDESAGGDGVDKDGYNRYGYDAEGYDRDGLNKDCYDRNGNYYDVTPFHMLLGYFGDPD